MLIDLHAHSHLSKGWDLNAAKVLQGGGTFGIDGVAFTETNTQDGCDELFALAGHSKLKVFVGLELITDKGQYLCFFPQPEEAPEPVQMWGSNREKPWSALECLPKLKSLGAVVIAARPYDRDFEYPAGDFILTLPNLSAVEAYNPKIRQTANDLASEAAESLRLPSIGGSDARASLDEVGRGATLFKHPVETQQALVEALLGRQYWPVMIGELPRLTRPGEAQEARRDGPRRRRGKGNRGRSGNWKA